MPALTVAEIAALVNGRLEGDESHVITGANALEDAEPHEVAFAAGERAVIKAQSSGAGCLLVSGSYAAKPAVALVRVGDPRIAFAQVLQVLFPPKRHSTGIHPTAVVAATCTLGKECSIGAYVTVGENTRVGNNCVIEEGCRIGDNVAIGDRSVLKPNTTIYDGVEIGARVLLHAGCVIGADGFGFTLAGDHYEKFPQVGSVGIGDDVEIGANSCVDRAALGVTRIGSGTKIDNLVHIGHNCVLGKHLVIAAQAGFSGSITVGDYAVVGGQAGIGEKAKIASKAVLGGKCGVLPSVRVEAGEPVWGIPARPLRQHLKNLANITRIAELREQVKELQKTVDALSETLDRGRDR
jgi:UDP-3-O-[3-hydroxymyristoyl] glucosamine N-acyltransferase